MGRSKRRAAPPPEPPVGHAPEIWLFGLALAARLLHLWWHHADFWLTTPLLDDNIFESWADTIAREGWKAPGLGAFDFNPAYPYFLTAARMVLGRGQLALFAFQHAAGALLAPLLYRVASLAFDRRAGLAAGFLAALYGPAFFFESRLLGEHWIYLFNAAALALLLEGGAPGFAGAGLCLGLSAVFRPTVLVFVPVAALWGLLQLTRPAFLRWAPVFVVGLWLPMLPFQLRNRLIVPGAGWGLSTSSGGVNLYLGNNPEADGLNQAPAFVRYGPGHEYQDFTEEAARRLGRPLSRAEVSRYWAAEVGRFFLARPGRAGLLVARKVGFFWNHKEPPDNFFLEIFRRFTRVGDVPLAAWGLVAPLGLAGLLWSLREGPRHWLLHGYVLCYLALNAAFYVLSRYRFPAAAGLIPFAGYALAQLVFTERRASLGVLCAAAFAASRLPLIGEEDPGVSHYSMGVVYANRGWKDKALDEYRASVSAEPAFKASWLNMGILQAEQGRPAEAAEALSRAAALEADPARKALIDQNVARLRGGQ